MTQNQSLSVSGMACDGCEQTVEDAVVNLNGVRRVEADHETATVEVVLEDGIDNVDIGTAIQDAGYDVEA